MFITVYYLFHITTVAYDHLFQEVLRLRDEIENLRRKYDHDIEMLRSQQSIESNVEEELNRLRGLLEEKEGELPLLNSVSFLMLLVVLGTQPNSPTRAQLIRTISSHCLSQPPSRSASSTQLNK